MWQVYLWIIFFCISLGINVLATGYARAIRAEMMEPEID